jgi:hypothetical protein
MEVGGVKHEDDEGKASADGFHHLGLRRNPAYNPGGGLRRSPGLLAIGLVSVVGLIWK